jgi:hypothetical protein
MQGFAELDQLRKARLCSARRTAPGKSSTAQNRDKMQ